MWAKVSDSNEFDKFISFEPIWLYATVNSDKTKLWQYREKRLRPEYAVEMMSQILDSKPLARYACIIQVCLKSTDEVMLFIENARKCGIYVKSVYKDKIPEGESCEY